MRIVRLANFVTPSSGGLRTALRELGRGYLAAGHEPILIVPGEHASDERTGQGTVITVPGPKIKIIGGYRIMLRRNTIRALLERLRPDSLEVSDRTTLRWTGAWARRHRVPSIMVSHESLEGLLRVAHLPSPRGLARALNRASAASYDRILCTTSWAAREFHAFGAPNVVEVPLGVDLDQFHPRHRTEHPVITLVCATRLSVEKRPQRALNTIASLAAQGFSARLIVAGDGPLRSWLQRQAAGLPVEFTGFLHDRLELARLLASADVVLAPGPIETFGLAALEALACGTPVIASESSALPDVIGDAGLAAPGEDFSAQVRQVLTDGDRRAKARARAEQFGWDAAVKGFLAVHEGLR
ncbi:MAG TPA: glycosyltransferase [Candidatus Limnocylindrales bacterium]|nr:glycosyltransferase [Candidatus Limnocylindrales bacterium]